MLFFRFFDFVKTYITPFHASLTYFLVQGTRLSGKNRFSLEVMLARRSKRSKKADISDFLENCIFCRSKKYYLN